MPARTEDSGLPPVATEIRRCSPRPGFGYGRGRITALSSGGRNRPDQVTGLPASMLQQQLDLLVVQGVVVAQLGAEQRVGLDERSPAGHQLDPTLRDQVDRGELLVDPHRVLGGQHGDRAAQPDPAGLAGRRGQHGGRRGHRVVGPVVFADAEEVQAHLLGQPDAFQQVGQPLRGRDLLPGDRVGVDVAEAVDAELHGGHSVPADRPCPVTPEPVGEELPQPGGALVCQHPAAHLRPDGSAAGPAARPTASRRRRSWVPSSRRPPCRSGPARSRRRTWCRVRR